MCIYNIYTYIHKSAVSIRSYNLILDEILQIKYIYIYIYICVESPIHRFPKTPSYFSKIKRYTLLIIDKNMIFK